MSKIEIPPQLQHKLGPEMKMDLHIIDLRLCDGKVYRRLVVRGGRFITGYWNSPNGEGELPFKTVNIENIRRQALVYWWPFW